MSDLLDLCDLPWPKKKEWITNEIRAAASSNTTTTLAHQPIGVLNIVAEYAMSLTLPVLRCSAFYDPCALVQWYNEPEDKWVKVRVNNNDHEPTESKYRAYITEDLTTYTQTHYISYCSPLRMLKITNILTGLETKTVPIADWPRVSLLAPSQRMAIAASQSSLYVLGITDEHRLRFDVMNLESGTWDTTLTPPPLSVYEVVRHWTFTIACTINNDRVYYVGGRKHSRTELTDECWVYIVATGFWHELPMLQLHLWQSSCTLLAHETGGLVFALENVYAPTCGINGVLHVYDNNNDIAGCWHHIELSDSSKERLHYKGVRSLCGQDHLLVVYWEDAVFAPGGHAVIRLQDVYKAMYATDKEKRSLFCMCEFNLFVYSHDYT